MAMVRNSLSMHLPPWRTMLLSMLLVCGLGVVVSPQVQLDVCGCKNNPASFGNVDTSDAATFPPGVISVPYPPTFDIPLPADGVIVFNSLKLVERPPYIGYGLLVRFIRNAANTPVTILVSGDLNIGPRVQLLVSGDGGTTGSTNDLGKGGLGGPGGFRGADGGYQLVNFGALGGAGLGPGGGAGGSGTYYANGHGAGGTFLGVPDLLPLVGGSGGGGGASTDVAPGCAGGGGGGGGGALLLAVNGAITIDGQIVADGGSAGNWGNPNCSSSGGGGSGGAVRLLATTISGIGQVYARGGGGGNPVGQPGSIRLEALNNTLTVGNTTPLATRAAGPGPVVNPITPTVSITSVGGQAIPQPPQGGLGNVDLVLPAPGQTSIGLSTSGVPTGTVVNVTVKPRVGSAPIVTPVTLTSCDPNGACLANVTFNLAAGGYFIEARATFSTP
jgi:hypothetical protein